MGRIKREKCGKESFQGDDFYRKEEGVKDFKVEGSREFQVQFTVPKVPGRHWGVSGGLF